MLIVKFHYKKIEKISFLKWKIISILPPSTVTISITSLHEKQVFPHSKKASAACSGVKKHSQSQWAVKWSKKKMAESALTWHRSSHSIALEVFFSLIIYFNWNEGGTIAGNVFL